MEVVAQPVTLKISNGPRKVQYLSAFEKSEYFLLPLSG